MITRKSGFSWANLQRLFSSNGTNRNPGDVKINSPVDLLCVMVVKIAGLTSTVFGIASV
jgi:hypothetical protein